MNVRQAAVLSILINRGNGIATKSPGYIAEKIYLVEHASDPERVLDHEGLVVFKGWVATWPEVLSLPLA